MTIDRKPENGYEIQDSCCGVSGIMMRLKIIKEDTGYSSTYTDEKNVVTLHGVKVINEFISS